MPPRDRPAARLRRQVDLRRSLQERETGRQVLEDDEVRNHREKGKSNFWKVIRLLLRFKIQFCLIPICPSRSVFADSGTEFLIRFRWDMGVTQRRTLICCFHRHQGWRLPLRRRQPEARGVHRRGAPLHLPGPEDGVRRLVRRRSHDQRPRGRRQGGMKKYRL